MNFLKIIFLVISFSIFLSCEELNWTNEDIFKEKEEKKIKKDFQTQSILEIYNEIAKDNLNATTKLSNDSISKPETIILSEDLELKETTIIKAKKVILEMVKIQTFEHNLIIITDEFLSNHSVIQNFKEDEKAKKKEDGRHGGNIFILANKVSGNLKLILNGENGGKVSKRRVLTVDERENLKGKAGKNGRDAIYKRFCMTETVLFLQNRRCRFECILKQTRGEDGGEGKQGFSGEEGKNGGDTGSFHLQAFDISTFYLDEIKKSKGLGSEGGNGSFGGFGGKAGRNGKDDKNLCGEKLALAKKGKKGKRGVAGKSGKNGVERLACLEILKNEYQVFYEIQNILESLKASSNNNKFSLLNSVSNLEEIKNKEALICY